MIKAGNRQKSIAALIILAVVYTVVVFAAPFLKNNVFWLSYLFTLAAIAGQVFVWKYAWEQDGSIQSKFYGLPIIMVGTIYLCVQFVAGMLFMLVAKWVPMWIPGILYVAALGMMLAGCIAADITRTEVERVGYGQVKDTAFIKEMRARAAALSAPVSEQGLTEALAKLQDTLKYSDPVSNDGLQGEEERMGQAMELLQAALTERAYGKAEEYARSLIVETEKRNSLCKVYKQQH